MAHLCGKMLSNNPRDMIYFPFIHVSLIFIYIYRHYIYFSEFIIHVDRMFLHSEFRPLDLGVFLGRRKTYVHRTTHGNVGCMHTVSKRTSLGYLGAVPS